MLKNYLDLQQMHKAAQDATLLLKTLANQNRLLLLCYLSQREKNVSELENELSIEQPTLSQQLGILRRANLVSTRREGKAVYYQLKDPKASAVIQTLYEQWVLGS